MAGRTQAALYAEIDLELSWSESDLPQAARTKHVHALHPYLGKFVPQLAETLLRRHLPPGSTVYDPFCGSGTTLVEANALGVGAIGVDISAFNCLLSEVKVAAHPLAELELGLRGALELARRGAPDRGISGASPWLERWYAPRALAELLAYRDAIGTLAPELRAVGRVVLSRAARSSRLTTHSDLDFPRAPIRDPYQCPKHRRTCRPVEEAEKFLRRYTADTIERLRGFAAVRSGRPVHVLHADARTAELPGVADGLVTSPPYPGLIDYHEQHRYAYELLGLADREHDEIGAARGGRTRRALAAYADAIVDVLANAGRQLRPGAPVAIVVNDAHGVYPEILERSGLLLETRLRRHVNRRTGRRAGEYFEDVLVCRTATAGGGRRRAAGRVDR